MKERTHLTIDLNALNHNVALIRKKIGDVKLMAVIKANAYGHGAVEVGKFLNDKADMFGVATVNEGVELRKAGLTLPILILGNTFSADLKDLFDYGLTPSVSSIQNAKMLSEAAKTYNKTIKIHIGIDTGMSRLGFLFDECSQIKEIAGLKGIELEGICTHYACADMLDKCEAQNQQKNFVKFLKKLKELGIDPPIKHISNSAGIIEFDNAHFNMVRAGIMLYGLYPSKEVNHDFGLKPVMSWQASVSHLKIVEKDVGISYGHIYKTSRTTKIATIPVGYADGYPRCLSSKGRILIEGKFANVVGRVCMDQFMIDVTDIQNVTCDSTVTILGYDGGFNISAEDLGDSAHSFNYEFVTGISTRVPRVYIKS